MKHNCIGQDKVRLWFAALISVSVMCAGLSLAGCGKSDDKEDKPLFSNFVADDETSGADSSESTMAVSNESAVKLIQEKTGYIIPENYEVVEFILIDMEHFEAKVKMDGDRKHNREQTVKLKELLGNGFSDIAISEFHGMENTFFSRRKLVPTPCRTLWMICGPVESGTYFTVFMASEKVNDVETDYMYMYLVEDTP